MNGKTTLSLYELNMLVRKTIEFSMPEEYWVEAELSEARENNGHCYMELVQKDEDGNTPLAKASAKCWRNTWMLVRPNFERVTGQQIRAGIKVLLKVYPQFHESYGFSWIVTDIDPAYTMGDMARKRQEIIRRLKEEGVFDLNKELAIPMFAQRIAVVTSANAAGYEDFLNQLENNDYGFVFVTKLFPAVMQGEQVEASVISALNAINRSTDDFDLVVIIRGGGSTSDLSGFDTLALAENVANFPIPVITGIGHERDESIIDMVAHTRMKTPTAAAAFIIDNLIDVYERINYAQRTILNKVTSKMEVEKMRIERFSRNIPMSFSLVKVKHETRLAEMFSRLSSAMTRNMSAAEHHLEILAGNISPIAERRLMKEKHRIEMLRQRAETLNPELLLKRGYSITMHNGHALRDPSTLKNGDEIETKLEKGTIKTVLIKNK